MDVKIGMKADGTLTAARAEFRMQGGAFPGSPVAEALECAFAPYKLDAVEHIGYDVLANRPKAAAYRAPGSPMKTRMSTMPGASGRPRLRVSRTEVFGSAMASNRSSQPPSYGQV